MLYDRVDMHHVGNTISRSSQVVKWDVFYTLINVFSSDRSVKQIGKSFYMIKEYNGHFISLYNIFCFDFNQNDKIVSFYFSQIIKWNIIIYKSMQCKS